MRTLKTKSKKQSEKRSLKIHTKYREQLHGYIAIPELRIAGKWLEELGFKAEGRVGIEITNGVLVIRPEN